MTTPTISNVTGTVTTGQALTITGTTMVDHDTTNWDSSFTESTSGFEGANPAADGWEVPGGYSYDSSVKLLGSKSLTITSSGSGQINNGVSYKLDASQTNQQRFQRLYCRMDNTVGNGSYPNNYHKLTLNYPNSSGAADLNLNWTCVGGGTAYPGLTLTTSVGNSASGTFTDGVFKDKKWYCIEQEVGNPHRIWVNNVLLFTGSFGTTGTQARVWDFNFNYNMEAPAGFASKQNFDGIVLSSTRIRPASVVEIGNSSNYATAQKVYQYPTTLSNTSNIVTCDLTGLGAGPYWLWVTNNKNERSSAWSLAGEPDTTAPTLSGADDGTPTSVGTDGASVSTDEDNGTLYWAVVTNGGSCTDAQLKAGSGGNIVAGVAANQTVTTTGTQIVTTITGLSASTAYQIKWLHRDAAGNDSSQASVNLTTAAADVTAPTLTNPNAGTPAATGTAGAHVDTNEGNGTLYWAVVTNGGSCTDAQLKAGTGGNIVSGTTGNQAVTSTGTKTILTISNLFPSTLYQIKFLHRDAAGNDSSQVSISLTTTSATSTLLFIEGFDNNSFAARDWYDSTTGMIDTGVFAPSGGNSSLKISWTLGSTSPTVPSRHLFTPTEQVYLSYWMKLGTAGVTWQGSGLSYHPHFIHLMTDSNGDYDGLSFTHLLVYVEMGVFTPRFAIQDAERINTTSPGYPQTISPGLLGGATAHAVAGGNGGQLQTTPDPSVVDWYSIGGGFYQNATFWDSQAANFVNNTWHHVESFVKMNTISGGLPQADGVLKYWVDDVLVINHTNVYLRTAQYATQKFNQFILAPYIGDGSPIAQDMWLDNLEVWNGLPAEAAGGGIALGSVSLR